MKLTSIISFLAVASSTAVADEVNIPHQFQGGTRAVAAEVNANFGAVGAAINDNAQRILALESALGSIGVPVSVDGVVVGRFLGSVHPGIAVEDPANPGALVRVREAGGLARAAEILAVSPTGYRFGLLTSDNPPFLEGQLDSRILYYDGADCSGDIYHPVEGNTGYFSTFVYGSGLPRPVKRWAARQGWVFRSPEPTDATPVYMLRRNAVPAVVPLASRRLYVSFLGQAICQNLSQIPGFDDTNSLHVDNWVVPVEANDATETGVSGVLGGNIMVGL